MKAAPPIDTTAHYKITKGENLEMMPYMVLDYPQIQNQDFKVVCRTLFWWGHYLSCQLIIQTSLIDIDATSNRLANKPKTRILTGENLWSHDCNSDEYTPLKHQTAAEIVQILNQRTHLKLVSVHELETFNAFERLAFEQFADWANAVVWK